MGTARVFLLALVLGSSLPLSYGAQPNSFGDAQPRSSGTFTSGAIAFGRDRLVVVGDTVYVANGPLGLMLYDIRDPSQPRRIGSCLTEAYPLGVRWIGDHLEVRTPREVVRLDISEPDRPRPVNWANLGQERDSSRAQSGPPVRPGIYAVVEHRAYIALDKGILELALEQLSLPGLSPFKTWSWQDLLDDGLTPFSAKPAEERTAADPAAAGLEPRAARAVDPGAADWIVVPVSLSETLAAQPLALSARIEAGSLRLSLSGPAESFVRIQRSLSPVENWGDWTAVRLEGSSTEIIDPEAPSSGQMFYRLIYP